MTHKERILKAARGEWADTLPFAPRIDLWYQANHAAGTLPPRHRGRTVDQIALAEGWALHKVIPDWQGVRSTEDTMHRAIGIFAVKEGLFRHRFSSNIEVKIKVEGTRTRVEYHTPIGMVSTTTLYTEEMKRAGASTIWIDEHIIKKPEDYRIVGSLFENIELIPDFDGFLSWQKEIGDNGLAVALGCRAASPMHHIQKDFLDATTFFYHYHDCSREMQDLAASMAHYFDQMLKVIGESPAEAVLWGANYDDMITFPPYFERDILPWIRKAADLLGAKGKLLVSHCDGENLGLMDLIRESGIHMAEAVTPHPMTKVTIEEYYTRWAPRLTIFGGIPSNLLLAECATEHEFKAYLDYLFKAVVPGKRFIVGVGDCVPPKAVFERLLQIGEQIEKAGSLPLEGKRGISYNPPVKRKVKNE